MIKLRKCLLGILLFTCSAGIGYADRKADVRDRCLEECAKHFDTNGNFEEIADYHDCAELNCFHSHEEADTCMKVKGCKELVEKTCYGNIKYRRCEDRAAKQFFMRARQLQTKKQNPRGSEMINKALDELLKKDNVNNL